MTGTGVIRSIDSGRRLVLPKELCDMLEIKTGDPIEVSRGDMGTIILRKHSPLTAIMQSSHDAATGLWQFTGKVALICDLSRILVACGRGGEALREREVTLELKNYLQTQTRKGADTTMLRPVVGSSLITLVHAPILDPAGRQPVGAVILIGESNMAADENEQNLTALTGMHISSRIKWGR